ncbi:unnamed protein product [Pleuronectes platessa]|uniref:Uncharacterized protein n=1 Tax=Pleuronectes platessa TaxID=8262 RepID=A0A9N7U6H5_PLEPL|nr:unnamed protein product [Pleuronectes platessa]
MSHAVHASYVSHPKSSDTLLLWCSSARLHGSFHRLPRFLLNESAQCEGEGPGRELEGKDLGATLQQWPLGHGREQGEIPAAIAHNNYTAEPNPPRRLFVALETPEVWQATGCEVSNVQLGPTSTLPVRPAACVVSSWALIKAMYV